MTTKSTSMKIHASLKDFECGKYSQCLKTLEGIQFPTFDLLEWVRDHNISICSLVSKQYTEKTSSTLAKELVNKTRTKLETLLTKIRSFNSAEHILGLVTECAVVYNLIILNFKSQSEQNSTTRELYFHGGLNSDIEITIKRILDTNADPRTTRFRLSDDDNTDSKSIKTVVSKSLLHCLKPLLHLWSCVVPTSEKQKMESLVKNLLSENSKEVVEFEWDLRFTLPAAPGLLANTNEPCDTVGNNMTAMFQVLDNALKTETFYPHIGKQITYKRWIPYLSYIEAYCLYQECEYQKALNVLKKLKPEEDFTGDILESFVLNLKGCCLFKLGHFWNGIQMFQSSLKKNFSFLLPLYNVTVVYRNQQKVDAELDSLKFLVKALESKHIESEEYVEFRSNRFEITKSPSHRSLTLPYALYLQSHRSLQLGHFSKASEHFLDLLTVLMETPVFQPLHAFTNSKSIPGIAEIHLEAAFCMLSAERYPECIAVCDWLLSCISDSLPESCPRSFEESSIFDQNHHSDQDDLEEDFLFTDSEISKKRPHSKVSSKNYAKHCISSELSSVNDVLVSALLYKADAYFHREEIENVFSCLRRATNIIKGESANLIPASPEPKPLSKRQKVSLESQSTSEAQQPLELESKKNDRNTIIGSVYNNTGVLLQCKGQFREALHCFRLGLQIDISDPALNFNCALTLIQLKEVEEAVFFWVNHRGFDLRINTVELQKKISEKQKRLDLLQPANHEALPDPTKVTGAPTPLTLLRFDICILCKLLRCK